MLQSRSILINAIFMSFISDVVILKRKNNSLFSFLFFKSIFLFSIIRCDLPSCPFGIGQDVSLLLSNLIFFTRYATVYLTFVDIFILGTFPGSYLSCSIHFVRGPRLTRHILRFWIDGPAYNTSGRFLPV